jgi:TPR repeat protein
MYAYGWGVPKDTVEAYAWLNLAASREDKLAREFLADIEGQLTPSLVHLAQQRTKDLQREIDATNAAK